MSTAVLLADLTVRAGLGSTSTRACTATKAVVPTQEASAYSKPTTDGVTLSSYGTAYLVWILCLSFIGIYNIEAGNHSPMGSPLGPKTLCEAILPQKVPKTAFKGSKTKKLWGEGGCNCRVLCLVLIMPSGSESRS